MCGISGYAFLTPCPANNLINSMVNKMIHRGPDNQGVYTDNNVALGHARLSIIDISAGANQPMISDDGNLVVVFNGEIYNFKELREELLSFNINFRSHSDTEVLLYGYKIFGPDFFIRLNGIFAFALWDKSSEKLLLVRDRFGVKPLYISELDNGIVFASEIKSILATGLVHPKLNKQSFHEFLYYGNALLGKTLYTNIFSLEPGHFLEITSSGQQKRSYWGLDNITLRPGFNLGSTINTTRDLLERAIARQLVSDVPIGIFLSGGIDSSCVTAFASKYYTGKLNTYSVGFDFDMGINELPKAKQISKYFGTNHHELLISTNDLPSLIEKLVDCHDQPFSDAANIPLYLLCEKVKDTLKVVLQGDGGDELFGGYRRYNILTDLKRYQPFAGLLYHISDFSNTSYTQRIKRFANIFKQKDDAKKLALLLTVETDYDPPTSVLAESFKEVISAYNPFEPYYRLNKRYSNLDIVQRMLWIDSQIILPDTFLEKVDRATMAHGVESRVPLLDNDLSEYILSLPSNLKIKKGDKKWLMKQALRGIVPDYVLDGPKIGFGVPYGNWLKGPLYNYFNDLINSTEFRNIGIFNINRINEKMDEYRSGKKDNSFLLWKVMNFAIWIRRYNLDLTD